MPNLHDTIEEAVLRYCRNRSDWRGTTAELCAALQLIEPSLETSTGDVDEAVRDLNAEGRLRLDVPHGFGGQLRLRPGAEHRPLRSVKQNISVTGGNVQIGDQNQQAVTYGNVLQTLVNAIQENPDLPEHDKRELTSALEKVLCHPFTQTIISAAAGVGGAAIGR